MEEEKKYFGMTRLQIGILAGLAVVLILVVLVGVWFVFRNLSAPAADLLAQNSTVAPTVTAVVTAQPTMTPTFVLTQIPYEQLIPADWKQYKTDLVEIWLPPNFAASSKKTSEITTNFFGIELLMIEVSSKSSAYRMQVAVTYDLMTGDSFDAFLENKFPHLTYQANVTDRRTVFVNAQEARRVVIEFRVNNVDYNDMVYVFLDGNTVWYVQYMAELSEFFDNLPIFEQSVKTFRPVKY